MREVFHPNLEQLSLATVLNALGDPIRLQILRNLSNKTEATCACCNSGLPKSVLSHHFKVLRQAGIINVRIEGKNRYLSIRYDELEERFPGLLKSVLDSI